MSCSPNKTDPITPNKECNSHQDCWKIRCPQTDPSEYKACVHARVTTSIPRGEKENNKPDYIECVENKCKEISTDLLGIGQIDVILSQRVRYLIPWLRLYIFPSNDLMGKAITCERLRSSAEKDPAFMMSDELGRYYPARDAKSPITTDVKQTGDFYPLPFLYPASVPAGQGRVIAVQGFCNPPVGRPDIQTKHQWWGCKEDIETKAGDNNNFEVTLPVDVKDPCTS
jgi:hypothetical protein